MTMWIPGIQEKTLPPIEKFYSKLNKIDIRTDDYEHAKNVEIWGIITSTSI